MPVNRFVSLVLFLTLTPFVPLNGFAQSATITTYVGPLLPVSGSPALIQTIGVPQGVAADGAGGFYVASSTQHRIYRVDVTGTLTVIAGNGSSGFSGDGGPADSAQLNYIHGIAADGIGNVFVADTSNNRIRKINPSGIITTVAGNGAWGAIGDGGPAISATLAGPRGVAVDATGTLFIADSGNHRIRRVSVSGIITTIAGTGIGAFSGDHGPATSAALNYPVAVAVDSAGNVFIADRNNHRIRRVDSDGVITTLTGNRAGFSGDGGPAVSALISDPRGVTVDLAGKVFIADSGNSRIRMISTDGFITTVAGTTAGFSGDGGPATSARLALPVALAVDLNGTLFVADRGNYRVRRISTDGVMSSVAGTTDDGGPATSAQLNFPNSIAVDQAGNLFVADTDSQRIRKIDPAGVVTTIAGKGAPGFAGDGGPATSALLNYPAAVAVDRLGNLFIADTRNNRIRKVTPAGTIATVAGNSASGFSGDDGLASLATLDNPRGVAVDTAGNLLIVDTNNHRIRKVGSDGVIRTVAGIGTAGFSGDDGPATQAQLAYPNAIAISHRDELFIVDTNNHRIRIVTSDGLIHTLAGTGHFGFNGDGGSAIVADLAAPQGIGVDDADNIYIADTENHRIREITSDGIIRTVVGDGSYGTNGDGGPATSAQLAFPYAISMDGANAMLIGDTFNNRIRRSVSPVIAFAAANGGAISRTTTGSESSIQTGYARIQSDADSATLAGLAILSYRAGGVLISETGIPAIPPLRSGRIYAEVNGRTNTGIAIANPNNQSATIRFRFTDNSGSDVGEGVATIGANEQIARLLDANPFKAFPGASFQGTFGFMADVPIGVMAIRGIVNERQDFLMSTLPVVDTSIAITNGSVVVPHYADGSDWITQILLVNPTNMVLTGHLEFRNDNGDATKVAAYTVAPRSSQKLAAGGDGPLRTGSVRIVPVDARVAPVAQVIFSYRLAGVTVSETGITPTIGSALRIYVEAFAGTQSGIAVANNSDTFANLTFELANLDGSAIGLPAPVTRDLPGFGHLAQFIGELFPALPNPFRGTLRMSTNTAASISVVGIRARHNERGDFLMTAIPPIAEATEKTSSELVVPHLVDGGGFTTQFILTNGSGSLRLFQSSGEPANLTLR